MSKKCALVVEDDETMRKLVSAILRARGLDVETASDGAEALTRVAKRVPDVVVSDVEMPGMSGWTLIKRLRSIPATAFVPVLFLTARTGEDDRLFGFRLGADDYLTKPFKPEEVAVRVEGVLARQERLQAEVLTKLARFAEAAPAPEPTAAQKSAAAAPVAVDPPSIQGALAQVGLGSLLVLLEMERRSGNLTLSRGEERVHMRLREGAVIRASTEGISPAAANEEAVYLALEWPNGAFTFHARFADATPAEIKLPVQSLLMEGARRMDERSRAGE